MIDLSTSSDLDRLLDDIGDRRIVMLGEASHGTHEYYTWRSAISKRLIQEKGFQFIGVEGDWPDCYRINRFVKGHDGDDPAKVLKQFDRWPTWMWANWEVAALAEWLREHNLGKKEKVGFYGLDVYSLWDSMKEIMTFLEQRDPESLDAARNAINCFAPYAEDEQMYARFSLTEHSCRDEVLTLLKEIRSNMRIYDHDEEAAFSAEQNALIAVNAEKYYRSMMSFDNGSWNVRDRHMMETLTRLLDFHGPDSKAIVWEHNTHIGDARATDMRLSAMINIGQLAREDYGEHDVYLVGFGSYKGSVIAGDAWGATMQEMEVPEARNGSIEDKLHSEFEKDGYLLLHEPATRKKYSGKYPHRAIGVVYDPRREKYGNYVPSVMTERYDAFVYIEETQALHPLHMQPHASKMPETYPFGY